MHLRCRRVDDDEDGLGNLEGRGLGHGRQHSWRAEKTRCSSRSCFSSTLRGAGQQALGALRLGEGDHVADRLGLGHQRDEAVQAKGQATVRGAPYCNASSGKPNLMRCSSSA